MSHDIVTSKPSRSAAWSMYSRIYSKYAELDVDRSDWGNFIPSCQVSCQLPAFRRHLSYLSLLQL